ncbi:Uncharacterised protein [uncultured archaeon]|nr:Uncharacterised protein [uncultured archaeon]
MGYQDTLVGFKMQVAVDGIRRAAGGVPGPHLRKTTQNMTEISRKYFLGDYATLKGRDYAALSERMGSAEERKNLRTDLEEVKGALAEEAPALKENALTLAKSTSAIHKGTFVFAILGGIGAAIGVLTTAPPLLETQFIKNIRTLTLFLGAGTVISLIASAGFALVAERAKARCDKIIKEAENAQYFIGNVAVFLGLVSKNSGGPGQH